MAVVLADAGFTDYATSSASWTLTLPTSAVAGTVMLLQVATSATTATVSSPPSGATLVDNAAGGTVAGYVYVYVVPSTPPASLTWGLAAASVGSISWAVFTGVDTTNPVDAGPGSDPASGTTLATSWAPASITTVTADAFIVGGLFVSSGSRTVTIPTGWTLGVTATTRIGTIAYKGAQASPGATGTASSFGISSTALRGWAYQLAFHPAAGSSFSGSLTLSGSGALGGTGSPAASGGLAATGSGVLSFAATVALAGSLALSGSGTLGMSGAPFAAGTLANSGSGSLSASGQPAASGTVALSSAGTFAASGTPSATGTLALAGSGALSLSGSSSTNPSGTLTLTGSGTLAGVGLPGAVGSLVLSGAGGLVLLGEPSAAGALALAGASALDLAGTPSPTGELVLSGSGTLVLVGHNPAADRDIIVTASLDPRRWAADPTPRDKTGALDDRAKAATLDAPLWAANLEPRRWKGTL